MAQLLSNIKSLVDADTFDLINGLFNTSEDNTYIVYNLYGSYLDYKSLITITYDGNKCELYEYLYSKKGWCPVFYLDIKGIEWERDKDYKHMIKKYPLIHDICSIFNTEILQNDE